MVRWIVNEVGLHMRRVFIVGVLLALAALAGCGGSASSSASHATGTDATSPRASGQALQLAANSSGKLSYSTTSLTANTGKFTIDFTNYSPLPHNVTIAMSTGKVLGATPTFHGGTRALRLNLTPGTYTFYCSLPGHRSAGMQGVLVVR
jgi:plastocyanin